MTTNKLSTLWIGDLEPYMDETFLKHSFTLMGENLLTAKVIRNRFTGGMMGYGFLDFGDEPTSLRVLHRCNGKVIPNASPPKRFKLNHATYGKEIPGVREWSLFVGDLSEDVDDLALFVAFSNRYPSVKAAKVVLDQNGVSKGYGFVRFFSETEYNNSLIEVQNTVFVGSKTVRVSIATPKSRLTETKTALPETVTNTVISSVTSGGSATSPAAVQQTAAQYYAQSYGYDYSSYYQAYYQQQQQQQQQQQAQQQYYGYSYDPTTQYYDYSQQMASYYDTSNYEVPDMPPVENKVVQDNVLEEHDTPLDIEQLNADTMARNEEAYVSLDTSRWLPTEGLNPPMVTVKF